MNFMNKVMNSLIWQSKKSGNSGSFRNLECLAVSKSQLSAIKRLDLESRSRESRSLECLAVFKSCMSGNQESLTASDQVAAREIRRVDFNFKTTNTPHL